MAAEIGVHTLTSGLVALKMELDYEASEADVSNITKSFSSRLEALKASLSSLQTDPAAQISFSSSS
jgi:hypothetical protein